MGQEFFQLLPDDFYIYSKNRNDNVIGVIYEEKTYELPITNMIFRSMFRREADSFEKIMDKQRREEDDNKRRQREAEELRDFATDTSKYDPDKYDERYGGNISK